MADLGAQGRPVMISIEAHVSRADGTTERLGIVSYWHANPLRRWAFAVRRYLRGR